MPSPKDERRNYADKKFDQLAQSIGRVALAWNGLHTELFGLFWAVSGISNGMIPGVVWHTLKVDRSQREILNDFIKSPALGINISKDLRREIGWLLIETNKLEDTRNDLIHTTFGVSEGKPFAMHLGQHKRGLKFDDQDIQARADWLFSRITLLSCYTEQLIDMVRKPDQICTQRPLLPERPQAK